MDYVVSYSSGCPLMACDLRLVDMNDRLCFYPVVGGWLGNGKFRGVILDLQSRKLDQFTQESEFHATAR